MSEVDLKALKKENKIKTVLEIAMIKIWSETIIKSS